MSRALIVAAVAGCYAPASPANAPCGPGGECPSGQTCVEGVCRGPAFDPLPDAPADPAPDGSPDDLDGDGVANANDNCPEAANADQHDEDADQVGDACDNCPHVANPTQANEMEPTPDEVGDACDPRPTEDGDTIERFVAFDTLPPDVIVLYGAWTVAAGDLQHNNTTDAGFRIAGVRDRVTVMVGGLLDSRATDSWIGAFVGEANGQYFSCGYLDQGGSLPDYHTAFLEHYDGADWNQIAGSHFASARLAGAFEIELFGDSVVKRATCNTVDQRGEDSSATSQATALVPGSVGVRSYGAAYRISYVLVLGHP